MSSTHDGPPPRQQQQQQHPPPPQQRRPRQHFFSRRPRPRMSLQCDDHTESSTMTPSGGNNGDRGGGGGAAAAAAAAAAAPASPGTAVDDSFSSQGSSDPTAAPAATAAANNNNHNSTTTTVVERAPECVAPMMPPPSSSPHKQRDQPSRMEYAVVAVLMVAITLGVTLGLLHVANVVQVQRRSNANDAPPPRAVELPSRQDDPVLTSRLAQFAHLRQVAHAHAGLLQTNWTARYFPTTLDDLTRTNITDDDDATYRALHWVLQNVRPVRVVRASQLVQLWGLASLYFATNNNTNAMTTSSSWQRSNGWLDWSDDDDNNSGCSYYGVTCAADWPVLLHQNDHDSNTLYADSVVQLDLARNALHGTIPVGITLLTQLRAILLADNVLSGALAAVPLHTLPRLKVLAVQHNQLTGRIPDNLLANGVFDTLFVHDNLFTGAWPTVYCPTSCPGGALSNCDSPLRYYHLDCHRNACDRVTCCHTYDLRTSVHFRYTCFQDNVAANGTGNEGKEEERA